MNMNRADDVSNMNGLDNVGGANDIDGRNEVSETNDMKCRQMAQTIHGRSRYGHELVGMLGPAFVAACEYYIRRAVRLFVGVGAGTRQLHERAYSISIRETRHCHRK